MKFQRLTTNLWFNTQAEEAARFYTSIFKNSKIGRITRYSKEGYEIHGIKEGTVMTIEFTLDGHEFVGLNGGPQFNFTEAISFIVNCETQEEIDYYWDKLTVGGNEKDQVCGWLKDQFGVSWQVVPMELNEMMVDQDQEKVDRVAKVLYTMKKIDLNTLKEAYKG